MEGLANLRCPKCSGTLARHAFTEDIALFRCTDCHGMLLEAGMLEKIRSQVRADEFFDVGHPKVGRALDGIAACRCPACGGAMSSVAHPEQTHVRIDSCEACGCVFLDAGELLDLSHDSLLERVWETIVAALRFD